MIAIEYEALIQAALKTLAINLEGTDSKVKKSILGSTVTSIKMLAQVIEDFIGYQLNNYTEFLGSLLQNHEHKNVLIMHMLEQTRCLHLFSNNYTSLCSTLKISDSDSKVCCEV